MTWAQRLKRVFNLDLTTCAGCAATSRARHSPAAQPLDLLAVIGPGGDTGVQGDTVGLCQERLIRCRQRRAGQAPQREGLLTRPRTQGDGLGQRVAEQAVEGGVFTVQVQVAGLRVACQPAPALQLPANAGGDGLQQVLKLGLRRWRYPPELELGALRAEAGIQAGPRDVRRLRRPGAGGGLHRGPAGDREDPRSPGPPGGAAGWAAAGRGARPALGRAGVRLAQKVGGIAGLNPAGRCCVRALVRGEKPSGWGRFRGPSAGPPARVDGTRRLPMPGPAGTRLPAGAVNHLFSRTLWIPSPSTTSMRCARLMSTTTSRIWSLSVILTLISR